MGICTCITIGELFELQRIGADEFYFSSDMSSIMSDYLFQVGLDDNEIQSLVEQDEGKTMPTAQQSRRRSTFFPLLLEESLLKGVTPPAVNQGPDKFLAETSLQIISSLDQTSLLLCKYFSCSLLKYSSSIAAFRNKSAEPVEAANQQHLSNETGILNFSMH